MEKLKISKNDIVFNRYDELDMTKSKLPWITYNKEGNMQVNIVLLAKYIIFGVWEETGEYLVDFLQVKDDKGFYNYYIYNPKRGLWEMVGDELFKGYIYKYIPSEKRNNRLKGELWSEISQNTNLERICKFDDFNSGLENYINFQDGLLDLKTKELLPHTSKIKSTIQIPCKYKEVMESKGHAPVFDKYMADLCDGKPDYRKLLLEFVGAVVSNIPGGVFKKALLMKGLGDTGKSKLRKITEYLIGYDNSATMQLHELTDKYNVASLYGKRLSGHGEASDERATNLNTFKALTGGDSVSSDRKYKGRINFTFNGLFWYNANFFIKFDGDAGKWVYDRLIIMEFNNVIPEEKRDKRIEDKMKLEKNGIMYQVLEHLYMLIDNDYTFHLNSDLPVLIERCKNENSSVLQFLNSCFDEVGKSSKQKTLRSAIYDKYKTWCNANGNKAKAKQNFYRELEQSASDEDGSFFCSINGSCYVRKYRFNPNKFEQEVDYNGNTDRLLTDNELYEAEYGAEKLEEKKIIDFEEEKFKKENKEKSNDTKNMNNILKKNLTPDGYFKRVNPIGDK